MRGDVKGSVTEREGNSTFPVGAHEWPLTVSDPPQLARRNVPKMSIGEMVQSVQSRITLNFGLSHTFLQTNSIAAVYSTEKIRCVLGSDCFCV